MAYLRLLWQYYDTEEPLPNNPEKLAFQIGASAADVSQILEHYFKLDGSVYRHDRCDKVIYEYHSKAEKAKASANARWKNANAMRTHTERSADESKNNANHKPITDNHKPLERQRATRIPEGFEPKPEPEAEAGIDRPKELANFRDYWSAKARDNTKLDWQATWRSWARKADRPGVSRFPDKNAAAPVSTVWHESAAGIKTRAAQLGVEEGYLEPFPTFKARVMAADRQGAMQ